MAIDKTLSGKWKDFIGAYSNHWLEKVGKLGMRNEDLGMSREDFKAWM